MKKTKVVLLFLLLGTSLRAQNLYVGSNSSGNTTNFLSGVNSFSNTFIGFGSTSSNNSLDVSNSGTLLINEVGVYVGAGGSSNSMTISGGATVAGTFGRIGDSNSSGNSVLVTGSDSSWINSNTEGVDSNSYVYVGSSGFSNSMVISNGGEVVDEFGAIGWDTISSNNIATVTGNGSLWTNGADMYVGNLGSGNEMIISDGGTVADYNGFIGWAASSLSNTVLITGSNSSWLNGANLNVGYNGSWNTLTISNGGSVSNAAGIIGYESNSIGNSVQVLGSNSTWNNNGSLTVGNYGYSNTMTIASGGVISNEDGTIGFQESSYGNLVNVMGSNSLWNNEGNLVVGNYGFSNTLVISNGGRVINQYATVGFQESSYGNLVQVTGPNSSWISSNNLVIGNDGFLNTVVLSDGATLFCATDTIMAFDAISSNNTVHIVGSGTAWTNQGDFYVGQGGSGNTLVVSNQATLYDSSLFIGYNPTSSNNTVIVSGSSITNSYRLKVGEGGSGNTLIITNGSSVDAGTFFEVGDGYNANNNTVLVTGSNSILTVAYNAIVGQYNSGNSLIIADGGTVIVTANVYASGVGYGGDATTTNNSIIITGSGSSMTAPTFWVGYESAESSLLISNGGLLSSLYGYVGSEGGSNAMVTITGTGSFWSNNQVVTVGGFVDGTTNNLDDGSGGSGVMTVANGASLIVGSNVIIGSGSNTIGTLNVGTYGGSDAAGSIIAPSITMGPGVATLNFNQTNTLTLTSTITGSGTVQQLGSGTTILTASNNYTGTTVVANGTLVASNPYAFGNSDLSLQGGTLQTPVYVVNSGKSAGGYGVITGNMTNNGTLIATPTGTLSINGNFVQNSTGTVLIQIASPSQCGQIIVGGTTTISGGTLELTSTSQASLSGLTFTIISSTNSIKGSFDTIVAPAGYLVAFTIMGDPMAQVTLSPSSYTQEAKNQNQYNVASALNTFLPATSGDEYVVKTALNSLTSAQYPNAFNQISPALYTSLATLAFNAAVAQYNEMVQRLGNIRVAGVGFSSIGIGNSPIVDDNKASQKGNDILIPTADNHWGFFADGNGIFANVNINNQLPGYSAQGGGITIGADYLWNKDFSTGVYVGYEGFESKQSGGNYISDNGSRFGLFGTYQHGGLFANAIVGGDSHSYLVNRGIQFSTINRTATSAPTAGELDSMLATGYDIKRGNFVFGPITSLQYTYFGLQPFTESGAQSLDLSVANANANSLVYSLGSHCFYTWQVNKNLLIVPQINLGWQHEFLQNPYALNATLGNGSSLTYNTTTPLRDSLYTGIGFTITLGKKYDASFFYNASAANPSIMSQNFFASLGMSF